MDEHADEVRENVAHRMAFVQAMSTMCAQCLATERRQVYTTPKSFLELITLYKKLLVEKTEINVKMKVRLEEGLKLRSSAARVANMQVQLQDEMVVVEQKKAETDELLVQVGQSAVATSRRRSAPSRRRR